MEALQSHTKCSRNQALETLLNSSLDNSVHVRRYQMWKKKEDRYMNGKEALGRYLVIGR